MSIDLGEVVQREDPILPLPTVNLTTFTGYLSVLDQRRRERYSPVLGTVVCVSVSVCVCVSV